MNNIYDSDELAAKYESFFTKRKGMIKPDAITLAGPFSIEEFSYTIRNNFESLQQQFFTFLMRVEWMDRHIAYSEQKIKKGRRSIHYNKVLSVFWRKFLGFSRSYFSSNPQNTAIRSYADEFYPNFEEINVLDFNFSYPFKFMTFECLFLVHKLPNRMIFLREGERKEMSIAEFEDYLLRWMTEVDVDKTDYKLCDSEKYNRGSRYIVQTKILKLKLALQQQHES